MANETTVAVSCIISASFCSTWPSVTSLISYSVRRTSLAVWPRDINMQLVVANNAKPHNQQIINSHRTPPSPPHPPAWLPPAHTSSTCGKKFSCMLQYMRPPPCCEAGDWLQRWRTLPRSLASDHLQRGQWKYAQTSENMVGVSRVLDADYSSKQIRGGEQVSSIHSSGIRFGTMEKLIHSNGVLSCTKSLLFGDGNIGYLTRVYITTYNMIFRPQLCPVMSEIWRLPLPWSTVTFLTWPQLHFFFSLLKQFLNFLQDMMEPSNTRVYQR